MNAESLNDTIKPELPGLLRHDSSLRACILGQIRQECTGLTETQNQFNEKRHQRKAMALIEHSVLAAVNAVL